ncbi:MAG: pteridine reductase [Cellvibrionaceae bacterium]|nr:pteridine reductase [Cellvibrionaceae bacterium]
MVDTARRPVALVTGGARRIGADIVRHLHHHQFNVIVHYLHSGQDAEQLVQELNQQRSDSAVAIAADLTQMSALKHLATAAVACWGAMDVLINNASSYYPTVFEQVDESQWDDLLASNTRAPFFLAQRLAPALRARSGCIINIVDIHAERPALGFSPYSIAKAASAMLTKSLARELAPQIRVNGVAPGAIIWPEKQAEHQEAEKQRIREQIPLQREGCARDIAQTVLFFAKYAPYITGQILAVDGGRSVYL